MSIEDKLVEAGYKKHVSRVHYVMHMTDILYQKCVRDDNGDKRYYINCYFYPENRINGQTLPEGVMFVVQFKLPDTDEVVDVSLSFRDIKSAETEFDNIWRRMGYGYCEE